MAKIFKVSGYLVDVEGDIDASEVVAEISFGLDGMINQHIHVEEADIGRWSDENPLNYGNCDLADMSKHPPDRKASTDFHRPACPNYTVEDALKKWGVDTKKGVDAGGVEH